MALITKNQEAYFHHISPGTFTSSHFALLEELDAGPTTIKYYEKEIGHIVLDGQYESEVWLSTDVDLDKQTVLAVTVGTTPIPNSTVVQ